MLMLMLLLTLTLVLCKGMPTRYITWFKAHVCEVYSPSARNNSLLYIHYSERYTHFYTDLQGVYFERW